MADQEPAAKSRPTKKLKKEFDEIDENSVAKFRRGQPIATKNIEDKKLKGRLQYSEGVVRQAQVQAAKVNDWLLPGEAGSLEAEGTERTWRFQQQDIVKEVDTGAARKVFDLSLTELGPYSLDFSRSGRHMLLGGRKGHLALLDWQRLHTVCELQVRETIRDVHFLHNETLFAVAQKKHTYIYDNRGIEIHCLKEHTEANKLEFLPYHHLLCSVGSTGALCYQDTSTGHIVATHRTKLGPCNTMRQNSWNAVLCLGHSNGTVTMWTPNISTPVVRMLCHHGPVRTVAVDPSGHQLITAGADKSVKVWDIRTYRPLHAYTSVAPVEWADVSQKGMLAIGHGRRVQVWKDALSEKAQAPYMTHTVQAGVLADVAFCPYEDILALGHSGGVSTMIVPGAGEPNYDSFVANPFQTRKQRREAEVHQLLDKLQPEMITLDPDGVGRIEREPADVQRERQEEADAANAARLSGQRQEADQKTRQKGKNKPTRRQRKKQQNIIEDKKPKIKAAMREQGLTAEFGGLTSAEAKREAQEKVLEGVPRALHRFYKK
ncbi:hypothetical protein Ndes2526A_g05736 [Nannochloris sp. 'desiccata']